MATRYMRANRYLPNFYLRDPSIQGIFDQPSSQLVKLFSGFKVMEADPETEEEPGHLSYTYICQFFKDYAVQLEMGDFYKKVADAFGIKVYDETPGGLQILFILKSKVSMGSPIAMLFAAAAVFALEKTGDRSGAIKLNDLFNKHTVDREDSILSTEDEMDGSPKETSFDALIKNPQVVNLADKMVRGLKSDGMAVAAAIGQAFREANYETLAGMVWKKTKSFSRTTDPEVQRFVRSFVKLPFIDHIPMMVGAVGFVAMNAVGLKPVANLIRKHYS